MPVFSIIVPVHNAEKTLRKCLVSLREQTFGDFEAHLVENGSTDASYAICREFAGLDPRFRVHVSEENCGPSGARNIGLDHAAGTFVAFLDSDDYVRPKYLEALLRTFERSDAVFFGYQQMLPDGQCAGEHIPHIPENCGYFETLLALREQDLFGYTWIKAFRSSLIGGHRFCRELNLMEDEVFACEVLAKPCRIAIVEQAIYCYVTGNSGSLMGRTHPDYCRKADAAYRAWRAMLQHYEKKEEALTQMANAHVARCMYYGFERDVDTGAFFGDLAESAFFRDATAQSAFVSCVRAGKGRRLSWMRGIYRLKIKIAGLLKR